MMTPPVGTTMARSTTLSDDAFRALRREKREGESDSDVVMRLVREARSGRGDPKRFLTSPVRFAFSEDELERFRARMAEADRRNAWAEPDPAEG